MKYRLVTALYNQIESSAFYPVHSHTTLKFCAFSTSLHAWLIATLGRYLFVSVYKQNLLLSRTPLHVSQTVSAEPSDGPQLC